MMSRIFISLQFLSLHEIFTNFDGKLSHKSITSTNIIQKDWTMHAIIQLIIKVLQHFLKALLIKYLYLIIMIEIYVKRI